MLLLVIGTHSHTGHLVMANAVGTEHTIINQKAENVVHIKRKRKMIEVVLFTS